LAVGHISVWRAVGLDKHVTVVMKMDEEDEEDEVTRRRRRFVERGFSADWEKLKHTWIFLWCLWSI